MDGSKSVSKGTRSMVRPGADHELVREEIMERASGEFQKKRMMESRVSARRKRCEWCARTDGEHTTSKQVLVRVLF